MLHKLLKIFSGKKQSQEEHHKVLGFNTQEEYDHTHEDAIKSVDAYYNAPTGIDTQEVSKRIEALGTLAQTEFERLRKKPNYYTPEDVLTLEAMERSNVYSSIHERKLNIDIKKLSEIQPTQYLTLQPKEVLFLWYINNKNTNKLNIAVYWTHTYNLDYQNVLEKLFKCGYLVFADMIKCLSIYKVSEIKDFLKQNQLSTSGKKQDLINRLIENVPTCDIEKTFSAKAFVLTERGQNIISANEHIIYFHQHNNYFNTPIEYVDELHKKYVNLDKYHLALEIFNLQGMEHLKSNNYGLYRNTIYTKSIVYHDNGDFESELKMLLQLCYLDICGFGNNNTIDDNLSFLAPGIIGAITNNIYYLQSDKHQIESFFIDSVNNIPIKSKPKAVDKCYKIIIMELEKGD